jgi:hypothetical protein
VKIVTYTIEISLADDADEIAVADDLLDWLCSAEKMPAALDRAIESFDGIDVSGNIAT